MARSKPLTRRVLEMISTLSLCTVPDLVAKLEADPAKVKHAVHTLHKYACVRPVGRRGANTIYQVTDLGRERLAKPWKARKEVDDCEEPVDRNWSVAEVIQRVPNSIFNMR